MYDLNIDFLKLNKDFMKGLTSIGKNNIKLGKPLETKWIDEEAKPEEYTKNKIIAPILSEIEKFGFDATGERKWILEDYLGTEDERTRYIDYSMVNKKKNYSYFIEAKPFNADLENEANPNSAIRQVKDLFQYNNEVLDKYNFGVATDGNIWIFIHRSGRYLFDPLSLETHWGKILSFLIGDFDPNIETKEEEISAKFYVKYRAILFGGQFHGGQIHEENALVNSFIKFSNDLNDREYLAQQIFDRLIFIRFLQRKISGIPGDLFSYFEKLSEDLINLKLKELFFDVFNTPKKDRNGIDEYFSKIPYLNGSLFLRNHLEIKYPDYRIKNACLKIIFDFLKTTKFVGSEDVIDENTLDPEILGYLFERSMTDLDRKGTGSYYTPKIITNYLAKECIYNSVIKFTNKIIEDPNEKISMIESLYDLDKVVIRRVWDYTNQITICDNACGSGAFLLASANVLFNLQKNITKILGVFMTDIILRRQILKNNLYGVDLNPNATEITKLRLWLWLVSVYHGKEIQSLPNTDFNIRTGNTLLGFTNIKNYYTKKLTIEDYLGSESTIKKLLKQKSKLIDDYKDSTGIESRNIKEKIDKINQKLSPFIDKEYFKTTFCLVLL